MTIERVPVGRRWHPRKRFIVGPVRLAGNYGADWLVFIGWWKIRW